MEYRKKPVVIEAIQFNGDNYEEIKNFVGKNITCTSYIGSKVDYFSIRTLEGNMTASRGDYIIKGVNGEFYPCKADIFNKTYEKVESEVEN